MSADISLALELSPVAIVPRETSGDLVNWGAEALGVVQPLSHSQVQEYLKERKPRAHWKGEEALIATLDSESRAEAKALVAACELVKKLTTSTKQRKGLKVSPACRIALDVFRKDWRWNPDTFRANYDQWSASRDWIDLVNFSKAPAAWRAIRTKLPAAFLKYAEKRIGEFKRDDATKEAIRSLERQWRSGRNEHGEQEAIDGYEKGWRTRNTELLPDGWSYTNITRQLKARGKLTGAVRKLLQEGISAARTCLPQVHSSRAKLRFLERVQFDDVKVDVRVYDPQTNEVMDLWLLIAHDVATGVLLGFGMRPARKREDDTQEHLTLRDMKQLCGWLLERYGLPPYTMHWVFECGTATVSRGTALALQEFLGDQIAVHFTSMIGGRSPVGYAETAKGNSGAKGSLESGNRLIHIIGSPLPGQTGRHYSKRPADLAAREKECKAIWELAQFLPEPLRGQAEYPLLTLQQIRDHIRRIARTRNSRTDHAMEGFEDILVWYNPADGRWHSQQTAPHPLPAGARVEKRRESPDERAFRLAMPYRDQWRGVSPEIITAFYEAKHEPVTVNAAGEIKFRLEGNDIYFRAPSDALKLPSGTKALAHFHPDDPRLVYLTNGKGVILGVWIRRHLVDDEAALSEALRYTTSALNAAKDYAAQLAGDEAARLDAMRARNSELLQYASSIEVTVPQVQSGEIHSSVAHALTTGLQKEKQREQDRQAQEADYEQIAREALRNTMA